MFAGRLSPPSRARILPAAGSDAGRPSGATGHGDHHGGEDVRELSLDEKMLADIGPTFGIGRERSKHALVDTGNEALEERAQAAMSTPLDHGDGPAFDSWRDGERGWRTREKAESRKQAIKSLETVKPSFQGDTALDRLREKREAVYREQQTDIAQFAPSPKRKRTEPASDPLGVLTICKSLGVTPKQLLAEVEHVKSRATDALGLKASAGKLGLTLGQLASIVKAAEARRATKVVKMATTTANPTQTGLALVTKRLV